MKFPTYLVSSRAAKMSPESATYLGDLDYVHWPVVGQPAPVEGRVHTIVLAPADIPRGPKVLVRQGDKVQNDDEPKLHVYVVEGL